MTSDQETVDTGRIPSEEVEGLESEPVEALQEQASIDEEIEQEGTSDLEAAKEDEPEDADDNGTHPMDVLLEAESYELEIPKRGEIRTGTIARVTETDILVDVGAKSEGVISSKELERLSSEQRDELTVGTDITVYVLRSSGRDGTIVLSLARAEEEQDWREAEQLLESQDLYEGMVSGYNKGGLIVKLGSLRGFVPASQVSLSRRRRAQGQTPDQRWSKMVDEPIITKVIEVDRRRNRLILSERAAAREARDALKERLIAELEPGTVRQGHVISLADFGAFVDIGGADGLVHLSEISWKRIAHPREMLKVGQKVEVKVLGVDVERKRISLSMKELEADPWDLIFEQYSEGQLVEGAVTKLTKFGAFASLAGSETYDIEGLIHISELSDRRIEHPREVVQEGQSVALRILKIDRRRRRIALSLKRVDSPAYADQDWQVAMQEIENLAEEGINIIAAEDEDLTAAESPEDIALASGSEAASPDDEVDAEPAEDAGEPIADESATDQGEPEEPEAELEELEAEPEEPEAALEEPEAALEELEAEPEEPEAELEEPEAEPEEPEAELEEPEAELEEPGAEPEEPGAEPEEPEAELEEPDAEPEEPGAELEEPDADPDATGEDEEDVPLETELPADEGPDAELKDPGGGESTEG
jgi:small subunit ribosomal protein S1